MNPKLQTALAAVDEHITTITHSDHPVMVAWWYIRSKCESASVRLGYEVNHLAGKIAGLKKDRTRLRKTARILETTLAQYVSDDNPEATLGEIRSIMIHRLETAGKTLYIQTNDEEFVHLASTIQESIAKRTGFAGVSEEDGLAKTLETSDDLAQAS